MSLFTPTTVPCPSCGAEQTFDVFHSVNADRRPDLRESILDGTLQVVACSECGTDFRLEPNFNYLHVDGGLWVNARPMAALASWDQEIETAEKAFSLAYGAEATGPAKDIGATLDARLAFGWPATREKLITAEAGIDDVTLELVKLVILTTRPDNPLEPGIELRLIGTGDDILTFAWISAATDEVRQSFNAPRALLAEIEGNEDWSQQRDLLSTDLFVDISRQFIIPEPSGDDVATPA